MLKETMLLGHRGETCCNSCQFLWALHASVSWKLLAGGSRGLNKRQ